jgi:hypothetical protein
MLNAEVIARFVSGRQGSTDADTWPADLRERGAEDTCSA